MHKISKVNQTSASQTLTNAALTITVLLVGSATHAVDSKVNLAPPTAATTTTTTEYSQAGDAEIFAKIIALNEGEINAASKVEPKKIDAKVLGFAKKMDKEHNENLAKTKKLSDKLKITPQDTQAVKDMREKNQREVTTLDTLDGKALSIAYMEAMVQGHKAALSLIDDQLKIVKSEELKNHLTATRKHVAQHLVKAESIRNSL